MNNNSDNEIETQIKALASAYPYPGTPDIAAAVNQHIRTKPAIHKQPDRRWAWAVATLMIIFIIAALSVPPVRAQILEFLQIGVIRVFTSQATVTPTPLQIESAAQGTTSDSSAQATPWPDLTGQVFPDINDLAGETTLDEARKQLSFPVLLPTYPPDLGPPDRVFLQDFEGPALLLVWLDPKQNERVLLDLLMLGPGTFAQKTEPEVIEHTVVNGEAALWTQGRHYLHLGGSRYENMPLVVEGNILIWEQGGITYRLETNLSLEEAVKIAESLE